MSDLVGMIGEKATSGAGMPVTRLGCSPTASTAWASLRRPPSVRLRESTGMTGTPREAARACGAMLAVGESVVAADRSSIVRATTSGTPVSAT